jgi:5-methylthioadenosine/S-adenosylhomocysteine deaminase
MSTCLKNCKFIVTQNSKREILEAQDILIEGNQIKQIGKNLQADKEMDCSQNIIIPGLINLHTHAGMFYLRGLSDDLPYRQWWENIIWPTEKKMTLADKKKGAESSIKEMLQTGTTCFSDIYEGSEDVADLVKQYGIRAVIAYGIIDINDKVKSKVEWDRTERFKNYLKNLNCSRVKLAIGPNTTFLCSEETLIRSQKYAKENNALVHIHMSEDKRTPFPKDLLGSNVVAAHCCYLSDEDIKVFAEKNAKVAHCPRANMKLASGVMPLKKYLNAGICVGLGTDSVVSNNNLDMFEEMQFAALLQKVHFRDAEAASAQTVLDMATINGAKALKLNAGSVEVGKLADLVLLDAKHTLLQPLEKQRIVSHLVYSANGSCVKRVIVDGNFIQI